MVHVKFINEYGKIEMGGGSHSTMNITTLSGLGIPPKETNKVSFAGQAGITTTMVKDVQRTITIGGDFYGEEEAVVKMLRVLYHKGTLICHFGNVKRQIVCYATGNSDFVKQHKSGIYKFALQFHADEPYFTDIYELKRAIYERKDNITGSFKLPAVFTSRTNSATVTVLGDLPIYPTIYVTGLNNSLGDGCIVIKNETTGSAIELNYNLQLGERVTVDIPSRRIISSTAGVITNKISDNTVLSSFELVSGANCITCEKKNNNDTYDELYAEIAYKNKYIAAVY